MDHDIREVKEMLEAEGMRVVRIIHGKHRKFYVTAPPDHGEEHLLVTANSPSCRRSLLNLRSTARQIIRRTINHKRFK